MAVAGVLVGDPLHVGRKVAAADVAESIFGCSRLGIGVLSKSDNVRLRMAVRKTWFRQLGDGIVGRYVFTVGSSAA